VKTQTIEQIIEENERGASASADQALVASPSSRQGVSTEGFDPSRGDILSVIARAAADPNVDIDKLERLLEMQERVIARNARAAYYEALSELQPKLPVITERGGIKDRNGNIQSTYALWEDVNEAIRPMLAQHGFSLSFKVRRTESEIITTGILSHRLGHSEESELSLPSDTSGSKNAVQAVGSSASYGKRYTSYALLNITTQGEDDNGQKGGAPEPLGNTQLKLLYELADAVGADKIKLCKYYNVESLKDLPAVKYDDAFTRLKEKNPKAAEAFLTGAAK
jgi:hypothetical protein